MPLWCLRKDCLEVTDFCDNTGRCPSCEKNCNFQLVDIAELLKIILTKIEKKDTFTDTEKDELAEQFAEYLSCSDHIPIKKDIHFGDNHYTFNSFNIQEFCINGLNIFVDCIIKDNIADISKKEKKEVRKVLLELMMNPIVLETQQKTVLNWILECISSNSIPFCVIQELTFPMKKFLIESWESLSYALHFSYTLNEDPNPNACVSNTLVVYRKTEDVKTDNFYISFTTPTGRVRKRNFAFVIYGDIIVCSVHMLHTSNNKLDNHSNMLSALDQICIELCKPKYENINSVILAGDFNCQITGINVFDKKSITLESYLYENKMEIHTWQPNGPTQYGKDKPVDGLIVLHNRRKKLVL
jgi:hypothetical protein